MTRRSLRRLSLALGLVLACGVVARPQDTPASPGLVGKVTDREGVATRKGLGAPRWTAANAGTPLFAGDWIKTGARGANALAVELTGGALLLGPGALVELVDGARVRLHAGEVELTPRADGKLVVDGTAPRDVTARTVFRALRAGDGAFEALAQDPRWLTGYRTNASTDAVGALVATVDGRDVSLTLGYHEVTVDVRGQVARTEIEESFVNHTAQRLEGVFYFPLPPDASISGFAMWIGDQQVHGEIVEKQRARAIFETILREKRDPALLEWSGGNLFKARVFPIEPWSAKRIKLTYTQVLPQTVRPDGKGELVYRHALASEHLRLHPLAKLTIAVTVSSQRPIVDVSSPTHVCRVQKTAHAARVEHEAEEVSPDRDFEVRIAVTRPADGLTLASHRRGDDGYFLLLVDAPTLAPSDSGAKRDEPLDLLILADTSGSLAGAARAAQLRFVSALLEALGPKDRFNLGTCDVDAGFAFERPREPTPAAREEALGALEGRRPLGWTDLDRAISAAAERAGPRTHVVYVGDGAVTTGDADPQAFARRAPSLYRGQGTFHVVVPGSSSEPAALQAIAALGGGTVRTLGGAEPLDVALALLSELAAPCAKDLRLRFEGLEVAAVYPEVLPSLPAGAQQVVVGRWNAATAPGEVQRGRVTLTGTIGGERLSTTHEVALGGPVTTGAEAPDDASFIPRLWARAHLEHLLSQGSSKALQARVVALSEEFQLITPYTSFLVLESDADRARFQVKKRLRLRDGEEFFAAGRADAQHALTRQAMLAARGWRRELRRRTLEGLADMGRAESVEALERALPEGGALAAWLAPSYGGGGGSFSFDEEEEAGAAIDGEDEDEDEPRVEEAPDEPLPSAAEDEEDADEEDEEDAGEAEEEATFLPLEEDDDEEASTRTRAGGVLSFDDDGSSYSGAGGRFRDLLPDVSDPWRPEATSAAVWPQEVHEALASVDLTGRVARAQGGLRIRADLQRPDSRGRLGLVGRCLRLLGPQRWVEAWSDEGSPPFCNWLAPSPAGALERGVVTAPWAMGRVRPARPADARGWQAPWAFADLLANFSEPGGSATLRRLDPHQVEVTLETVGGGTWGDRTDRTVLVLEPARGVLRSVRLHDGSTVSWDVAEVAGAWFPSRETCRDAVGAVTQVTTFAVEALAPAAFDEALAAAVPPRASSLLLGPLPTRRAAKAAVRAGTARLEDRWVLLGRLGAQQRWDLAREHLDAVLAAAPPRAGEAIRATALRLSRRQEELRVDLRGLADALVATPRPHEVSTALELLTWAEELGTDEQLDLIARLAPVVARHPERAGAARDLGRREAEALDRAGRADEALARLRALAAAQPEELALHVELARFLFRDEPDAAVAHLDAALREHGPWPVGERRQLASTVIGFLAQLEDDQGVVSCAERLEREDPDVACAVAREHLVALTMLDRADAVQARLRAWIEPALAGPVAATGPARARLEAAVRHVLDAREPLSDERAEWIARLVRTQPERDDLLELARTIVSHERWNGHPVGRATVSGLIDRLPHLDALRAVRLMHLLLTSGRATRDTPAAVWEGPLDLIEARLRLLGGESPGLAGVLRGGLMQFGDEGRRLRLLREAHTDAQVEGDPREAAGELLAWLLDREWTEEAQTEALLLVVDLGPRPGDAPGAAAGRRVEQALVLHHLADWATVERADQEVTARADHDALDRRRLRRATDEALGAARATLVDLLGALEPHAPSLRDWLTLERAWLQVKLGRDREVARAACLGLLDARLARTSTATHDALVADRALSTLLLLVGTDQGAAQTASAGALAARLERAVSAGDDLLDWRQARVSLLLLCDRLDEVEAALREQPTDQAPGGFLLASLLAERDRLAEAAAQVERLASEDEVGPGELLTLSAWYTALDRPDAARAAQARAWALADEGQLTSSLWRELDRVSPDRKGVPEALGPATDLKLIALSRKTRPDELVDRVQSLYEPTRDVRLLGALAEGVLGQSAETVYALLESVQGLTDLLQEEATLDGLRAAIQAVRARAGTTAPDARALRLLELIALCGAVAQEDEHESSAHAAAALGLLRAAWPQGTWAAGEPLLYAELLARQGVLPGALGQEQLRQLQGLVRLGGDPTARLTLTRPLATFLTGAGRLDDAARALTGAIDAARGPDGLLAPRLHWALGEAVDLLMAMGQLRDAEALLQRELEPPGPRRHGVVATQGLRLRLHGVRLVTLSKNGDGLAGSGRELYRVAEEALRADLARGSRTASGEVLMKVLCDLWGVGARFGPVRDDVKRFAFGELPSVLARHPQSMATKLTAQVVSALVERADPVTALELLVLRAEAEPVSARLRGVDLWSRLGERFGELRSGASREMSPTLSLRLLEQAKAQLRRALRERRHEVPSLCGASPNRHLWREQRETWRQVALEVLAEAPDDPTSLRTVTSYLASPLSCRVEAIDLLLDADRRGVLDRGGRELLCRWLQHEGRFADTLPFVRRLIDERPHDVDVRLQLARALARTGEAEQAARALKDAEAYLRETGWWSGAALPLARAHLELEAPAETVRLAEEAVTASGRAGRDDLPRSVVSFHELLAEAYAALGDTARAVDAACAVVLVRGADRHGLGPALWRLEEVLVRSPDLDDYVAQVEREERETGLENATLRRAIGHAYRQLNQPAPAEAHLRRALAAAPNDVELRRELVELLDALDRPEEAVEELLALTTVAAHDATRYLELGDRWDDLGEDELAERARTNVVEQLPNESESHALLAELRERQGRLPAAVEQWRQVVRVRADDPGGWLGLARALIRVGAADEARAIARQVLATGWDDRFGHVHGVARAILEELGD